MFQLTNCGSIRTEETTFAPVAWTCPSCGTENAQTITQTVSIRERGRPDRHFFVTATGAYPKLPTRAAFECGCGCVHEAQVEYNRSEPRASRRIVGPYFEVVVDEYAMMLASSSRG